jgi:hypothetical protein
MVVMDWRERALVLGDVVFFKYVQQDLEKVPSEIYVWDLDKTYLDTHFHSVGDLFRVMMEKAFQKRNIPGTASLVKALAGSFEKEWGGKRPFPIYFITASPPQIEGLIKEKLELDEILPFGCFFKDNLRNIHPSRFRRLTQQIGYKVQALMQLRTRLHENVRQVCWGDDSESAAVIYSLYSDICARRLSEKALRELLRGLNVGFEQIDMILDLQARVPAVDPVEKVYINLATDTDPEYYLKFGRRTLATYNTFQAALDLYQDHRINFENVLRVVADMEMNFGFSREEFEKAFDDLISRQVLGARTVSELSEKLKNAQVIHADFTPRIAPREIVKEEGGRVFELEGHFEPWVSEQVDYLHETR